MKKQNTTGELEATYFENLPHRCKQLFFEFLVKNGFQKESEMLEVLDFSCEKCKSPIEQIFRFAYELVSYKHFEDGDLWYWIEPQEAIKVNGHLYHADFLFDTAYQDDGKGTFDFCKKRLKVVIECDGHEFHEKTKRQVIQTNRRNYDLNLEGYEILHFSGSEIFNDPLGCAERAYNFIDQKIEFKKRIKNGRKKNVY